MKIELIDTRPGLVIFTVNGELFSKVRKVYGSYGRIYFTYKKQRIFLDEFVPQRDGALLLIK